ncbi:MAG: ABC transporter substrate-binding protein [Chloroflexi bacterium]|nr:ABC transporter substrate-binding protein [Chloroflexota bacterium]
MTAGLTSYPATLRDDSGVSVTIPKQPEHIVSLSPSVTEIIYAVGAGPELVAGTQYDNYPPQAKKTALIKGLTPSLEAIVGYSPDLVVADSVNSSNVIGQLRALHIPVIFLDAHNLNGVYHDITLVGAAVNHEATAEQVVRGMQAKEHYVEQRVAKVATHPRTFVEIDASDPAKIYTAGPGSFIDALVTLAGGVNVAHNAKTAYPQYNLEALLVANPQIIVLTDAQYGVTPAQVAARTGWAAIAAVKSKRVYPINADLVSRPGPRLVDGLEALAKIIHPDLFR